MQHRIAGLPPGSSIRGLGLVLAAAVAVLGGVEPARAQGGGPCDQVTQGENALCLGTPGNSILLNEAFTVELTMSFFDTTVGGDVFLTFDPALSLVNVTFDPNFPDDPDLRCPGLQTCQPDQLAFGNFNGISGTLHVLTLGFLAPQQPGTYQIGLTNAVFSDEQGGQLTVQLVPTAVNVVPEPGTSSLLAFGLLVLARGRRHRSLRVPGPVGPPSGVSMTTPISLALRARS